MVSPQPDDIPAGVLRTMQIIAAAMIVGVVFALAIFVFLALVQQQKAISTQFEPLPIITLVLLLMLTTSRFPFSLPSTVTKNHLRQIVSGAQSLDSLLPLRQTTLIIQFVFLEGTAFLGSIAFFRECHAADLLVAGLPLALMVGQFPTHRRVRAWLATQLAAIEALRLRET
jgi:hypothetical protein